MLADLIKVILSHTGKFDGNFMLVSKHFSDLYKQVIAKYPIDVYVEHGNVNKLAKVFHYGINTLHVTLKQQISEKTSLRNLGVKHLHISIKTKGIVLNIVEDFDSFHIDNTSECSFFIYSSIGEIVSDHCSEIDLILHKKISCLYLISTFDVRLQNRFDGKFSLIVNNSDIINTVDKRIEDMVHCVPKDLTFYHTRPIMCKLFERISDTVYNDKYVYRFK